MGTMEHFFARFVPFLNEVAIGASIQILISLLLEESTCFSLDTLFHPIFARPDLFSFQVMAYIIYGTVFYCVFQFLNAFSRMPMIEAGEYQMAALYWYPITAFELVENHMDDDWDYIAPLFATIHHIYMVFICCFIGLSMMCGLMILCHLPSWNVPYLQWFRSAGTFIGTIFSNTFRIFRYIYATGESLLEWCLYRVLPNHPLWLTITSTGLILGDILLAMWAANLLVPARPRYQFNTTELCNVSLGNPRHGPVLTWHFGDPNVPGYDWKIIDLTRRSLQSCSARFAHWYNNQHVLDEMHHYPALTGTVMFIIIFLGFNWIWEDKSQRLRQVEHAIEETLCKNAITHEFEGHLRKWSSRTDAYKEFMVTNLKVIRSIIARNMTLMNQYRHVTGKADSLQANLTDRAQRLDAYKRENIDLRRLNTNLRTELSRLRTSADVQAHTASLEALNARLVSANNENANLQQQRDKLNRDLEVVRQSRASAEARATAAETARRIAVIERSALRKDVERLEQQNAELQQNFQEVSEQQSALDRARAAAETELRSRNTAMAAHVQHLQGRLSTQEAHSAEIIKAAEERAHALQIELEHTLAREEKTRMVVRGREVQLRNARHVRQKNRFNLTMRWKDAARAADAYKESNKLLEKRLVELDATLKDSTQTIHDPRKNNEIGQIRRRLEKSQARNTVLEEETKILQETINRLERRLNAAVTMSPAHQSPSTTPSFRADSDELVRLRNELTRAERTIRDRDIRISNLEAQQGGSRSGNPFRGQSRGLRRAHRG
ncbi:uncharacterized protein BHQ10_005892 [Talaromyces amestolkiae]|uniref:Uncharacterized protein n=1 Tax=Talaromyces amestolkiae TaxID=1196081 RepID=A0A364L261_TALAM|nr:uncharacterized protein BHQ10_005892 [Talaromyces amestolkiae]RAO69880.1 hypothetical protein BHQ10_005892 [Talaromyces amestolkiae]